MYYATFSLTPGFCLCVIVYHAREKLSRRKQMRKTIFKKVKKEMIDQEICFSDLVERTGYTREHLSRVINGKQKSVRAQKAIAFALGRPPEYLWGSDELNQNRK